MRLDTVFKILIAVTAAWTYPQFKLMEQSIKERQAQYQEYPSFLNFSKKVFLFSLVLITLRVIATYLFKPLGNFLIPKGKWSEKVRELKVNRFAATLFKTFYFIFISVFAYLALRDQSWMPRELGGEGDLEQYWTGYPFQQTLDAIHIYFVLNFSYQTSTLLFELTGTPLLPDFWQTVLQHVCAMLLISFSYMANYLRVGAIVMFTHDICDILSCGCRVFVETRYKSVTISLFFVLVFSWAYFRLYCFPKVVLYPIVHQLHLRVEKPDVVGWLWFVFLLLIFLFMNIYWFILMLKMFAHYMKSDENFDVQLQPMGKEVNNIMNEKCNGNNDIRASNESIYHNNNNNNGSNNFCHNKRS